MTTCYKVTLTTDDRTCRTLYVIATDPSSAEEKAKGKLSEWGSYATWRLHEMEVVAREEYSNSRAMLVP